ncbi:MAG: NAD-dependent epimerase/dehydratase family protein [Bacteroidetes bacterium]|jgi:dihydroflavonol-4-reductase|nr:NAD-dependent epimerase/dehydratase family protein [Bacteroidota bacterium]
MKILVTGGSGFLGMHCVQEALRRGHTLRVTTRDVAATRAEFDRHIAGSSEVELVSARLEVSEDWEGIAQGCEAILHTASPFPALQPKDPMDVIRPASMGVRHVVRAAQEAGISRMVMTSSIVAMLYPDDDPDGLRDRTVYDWTNENRDDHTAYVRSKAYAERYAWELVSEPEIRLTTILPGLILGPPVSNRLASSHAIITGVLDKTVPLIPPVFFGMVDVRDVAAMHLDCLAEDATVGHRLPCAPYHGTARYIVEVIQEGWAEKLPRTVAPAWAVRLLARFDPRLEAIVRDVGVARRVNMLEAQALVPRSWRTIETSVIDTLDFLVERLGYVDYRLMEARDGYVNPALAGKGASQNA